MIQPEADEKILTDSIDITFRSKSVQTYLKPNYIYRNRKDIPFREVKLVGLSDIRLENKDLFLRDYIFVNGSIFGRILNPKAQAQYIPVCRFIQTRTPTRIASKQKPSGTRK